jgi:hypothetical protein
MKWSRVYRSHSLLHPWNISCRRSPYYQNTALYPMIDLLERMALAMQGRGDEGLAQVNQGTPSGGPPGQRCGAHT